MSKVVKSLKEAVQLAGIRDGMTVSFHHHLRNGDFVLNMVLEQAAKLGIRELLFGCALGIPNFLSSLFLLNALDTVPAVVAFPTFSVAVILVVSAAGIAFFGERLTRKQLIGGALICISLVLLNL